jgi:hypothetical protein
VDRRADERSVGPRHRRRRGPRGDRGRHRFVYAPSAKARWMIPAGLALVILVVVTTVLLVTDVTTS